MGPGIGSRLPPLTPPEQHRLEVLKRWARGRLTAMQRQRKYRPRETVQDPAEAELLQTRVALEKAAGRLLAPEGLTGHRGAGDRRTDDGTADLGGIYGSFLRKKGSGGGRGQN